MSRKAPDPYVGPVPFERDDKRGFYGRDGDLRRLAIHLIAQRIVLLYSPSGAGKTSLVQARLIPALEMEGFEVLPVIRVSQDPPDGSESINIFVYNILNSLQKDGENGKTVETFPDYWDHKREEELGNRPAVLFFDQFEEVLTIDSHDQQQKVEFFDQVGAVLEKDDNLWALFAIREDYLAELDPYRHLIPGKLKDSYRLELLNEDQAMAAVQKPAADEDVIFGDEAAEKLVDQLRRVKVTHRDGKITFEEGPFVEPVQLQIVCQTLWRKQKPEKGGTISLDSIGAGPITAEDHVDESLGQYYDDTVEQIAKKCEIDERDIRDWFDHDLIKEKGLRGQVMGSEDLLLSEKVIHALVNAHLIRAEERRGIQWYELAHDRLVNPVNQRNKLWYRNNLNLLQVSAEAWNKNPNDDLLLSGAELDEAENWADDKKLKDHEEAFLQKSRDVENTRKAGESRNKLLRVGAIAGLCIVLILTVVMFMLWQSAEAAKEEAEKNERRADDNATIAAILNAKIATIDAESINAFADANLANETANNAQATANSALVTAVVNPSEQTNAEQAATHAADAQSTANAAVSRAIETATEGAQIKYVYELMSFMNSAPNFLSMQPGTSFSGSWTLRNTSSSNWPGDTRLVFVNRHRPETEGTVLTTMGAPESVTLHSLTGSDRIEPYEVVTLTLNFKAPQEPGKYAFNWQLVTLQGEPFGGLRWMVIQVVDQYPTPVER